MAGRLVTVATFDSAPQAHVAKGALEAAGIQASVTEEIAGSLFGPATVAMGGIKVLVREEYEERARTILDETFEDEPLDEEDLADEAEAAEREDDDEPPAPTPASGEGPEPPTSERDEYARRLLLAAVISLLIPPVWFYALYLFLNAAFGPGPLSDRGWAKLIGGVSVLSIWFVIAAILFLF
jgi:hypothetical protein